MAKVLNCFTLLVFVLCFNSFATAQGGGQEGSGGGNAEKSADRQVMDMITMTPDSALDFANKSFALGLVNYENISDPELRNAARKIFGLPKWRAQTESTPQFEALQENIRKFSKLSGMFDSLVKYGYFPAEQKKFIILSEDGTDCAIKENVGASTQFHNDAPICFNISELKRLPPDSLRHQLFGLFFHELTHQYGFNEDIAVKMQALILRASSNTTLALKVLELQKLLAPANGNSTGFICSKIGGIQALSLSAVIAQPIRTDLLAGLSGQYMDLSQLTGAQQFNKVVSELADSCDGEKQDYGRLGFLVRLLDYSLKSQ